MKQRMGIAVALFNEPEILFLDEPTSALDPEGRMEVLELINRLKENNVTVFLSTHILNDVERVCDEVSIIDKGNILLSQRLEDLKLNYLEPIYDIEFEKECSFLRDEFSKLNWVQNVKVDQNRMHIYVNDINISRSEILKTLATLTNPILSFNLRKSTLEDIFLRLVSKNENI
jgi:ABC-2 type transport system ATP-binding protein